MIYIYLFTVCSSEVSLVAEGSFGTSLSASSIWGAALAASEGVLGGGASWSSGSLTLDQYLEADFGRLALVQGISTQGRANSDQWVQFYHVSFSEDGSSWEYVRDAVTTR